TRNLSVWPLSFAGPAEMPVAQAAENAPLSSPTVTYGPFVKLGTSLTAVTIIVTVAAALAAWPSDAVNWNVAVPLKFAAGVNVNVPFGLTTAVPLAADPATSANVSAVCGPSMSGA